MSGLTQAALDALGDDIDAQTEAAELAAPPTDDDVADLAAFLARVDIRIVRAESAP